MRQIGKQILTLAALAAFYSVASLATPANAGSLVTGIVTDPLTGIAIEGFDPVSYFTDAEPQPGKPDYEFEWGGVPWYFASAANRDVFMRAPEIYAPQHGGHCEMSLARGYLSDGKPRIYAVIGERLYLFYSSANRDAFLLSQASAIKSAELEWAEFSKNFTTN
jgi:YHS domain-containing protein